MSPTIGYDEGMVQIYRKEPGYAIEIVDSLLEDGEPREIETILRQLVKAFGAPPGYELPECLSNGASSSEPTLDGLKSTLLAMQRQIGERLSLCDVNKGAKYRSTVDAVQG